MPLCKDNKPQTPPMKHGHAAVRHEGAQKLMKGLGQMAPSDRVASLHQVTRTEPCTFCMFRNAN